MMRRKLVRVGTRSSPLAVVQTEEVIALLRAQFPEASFRTVAISTTGDRNKDAPLQSLGRGSFVKDIEAALAGNKIDLAVHSAKDVAPDILEGLVVVPVSEREDPRDVLVNRWGVTFDKLPPGARIGTSSPRRASIAMSLRSDIALLPIRGNVGTRLEKSRGNDYDGVILAAAGLRRLGLAHEVTEYLSPEVFVPDVGQGILAAEARAEDEDTLEMLQAISDPSTAAAFRAERSFLTTISGGCKVPVAAYARLRDDDLQITAMAAAPDGRRVFRVELVGERSDPEKTGRTAAMQLLDQGAGELMGDIPE